MLQKRTWKNEERVMIVMMMLMIIIFVCSQESWKAFPTALRKGNRFDVVGFVANVVDMSPLFMYVMRVLTLLPTNYYRPVNCNVNNVCYI